MSDNRVDPEIKVIELRDGSLWVERQSHGGNNPTLKICALRLGMFHGERFVKAANTYLDTLIQGAA